MLRLRSRVIQLSTCSGADWLAVQSQQFRRVCPRVTTISNRRRYSSSENVEYKPIKKLLVANRGKVCRAHRSVSEQNAVRCNTCRKQRQRSCDLTKDGIAGDLEWPLKFISDTIDINDFVVCVSKIQHIWCISQLLRSDIICEQLVPLSYSTGNWCFHVTSELSVVHFIEVSNCERH